MKKKMLGLIVGFLFIGFNGFAADGDLIVNGKVGIGNTNPTEKLEVNGNVKATSFIGPGIIKQIQTVSPTTDVSTTSTTFIDLQGMSINLTTGNSILLIFWDIVGFQQTAQCWINTEALLDGSRVGGVKGGAWGGSSGAVDSIGNQVVTNVTAGSHTAKIRWKVTCGTAYVRAATYPDRYSRTLTVIEVSQ